MSHRIVMKALRLSSINSPVAPPTPTPHQSTDLSLTAGLGEELPTKQFMILLNRAISIIDVTNFEVQATTCAPIKRVNVDLHITWNT